jgi:hypothetical protein
MAHYLEWRSRLTQLVVLEVPVLNSDQNTSYTDSGCSRAQSVHPGKFQVTASLTIQSYASYSAPLHLLPPTLISTVYS